MLYRYNINYCFKIIPLWSYNQKLDFFINFKSCDFKDHKDTLNRFTCPEKRFFFSGSFFLLIQAEKGTFCQLKALISA